MGWMDGWLEVYVRVNKIRCRLESVGWPAGLPVLNTHAARCVLRGCRGICSLASIARSYQPQVLITKKLVRLQQPTRTLLVVICY